VTNCATLWARLWCWSVKKGSWEIRRSIVI
jgi:hypothetical protein